MQKFIRISDRISQACGSIAGIMILAGFALIFIEVVIRKIFGMTLHITGEYTGYLMVGITFLALSYTLKERGHIRMVFLHKVLKGKARVLLDIYAFTVGLAFSIVLIVTTSKFFWNSVEAGSQSMEVSETYLAIPQFFMPLGSLFLAIQFAAELIRAITKLREGKWDEQDIESGALGR